MEAGGMSAVSARLMPVLCSETRRYHRIIPVRGRFGVMRNTPVNPAGTRFRVWGDQKYRECALSPVLK